MTTPVREPTEDVFLSPNIFASAVELPQDFVEWQLDTRRAMFERIAQKDFIPSFGAHLPVLVTFNAQGDFPIPTAHNGAGFTPRDEFSITMSACFRRARLLRGQAARRNARRGSRQSVCFTIIRNGWICAAWVCLRFFKGRPTATSKPMRACVALHGCGSGLSQLSSERLGGIVVPAPRATNSSTRRGSYSSTSVFTSTSPRIPSATSCGSRRCTTNRRITGGREAQ